MAYADQQMSGNRMAALIIVALLHVAIGYALVTGLAYEGAAKLVKKLTTVDIKEEVKKDEPPPPPPKKETAPPPPVAPPVRINVQTTPPQIQTTVTPPPPAPVTYTAAPPAATPPGPPPPPPPPPKGPTKPASPKGQPGNWANSNDYPSRALREEKEGVTRFRVTVSADGRVTSCDVTGSSGSPELDSTTCSLITRRGRFNPAMEDGSPTTGSWSSSVRWQIPKE
jgi:periplasmic protein TonB